MNFNSKKNDIMQKLEDTSQKTIKKINDTTVAVGENIKKSVDEISIQIKDKKEAKIQEHKVLYKSLIKEFEDTSIKRLLDALGESPIELNSMKSNRIKSVFPIPREQTIIWADAEFDVHPSGIAITDKGVFIRTNVDRQDGKEKLDSITLSTLDEDELKMTVAHNENFHGGKAVLIYYSWEDFDPLWFTSDLEVTNKALLVESQCSKKFIEACRKQTSESSTSYSDNIYEIDIPKDLEDAVSLNIAEIVGAATESAEKAIFLEQKAIVNTPAGHGEMAEECNNLIDNILGCDAKVLGRDNAKNGPDRVVDNFFIQSKYYKTATGSLEACFDPQNGEYRYVKDGKPMQLEVPKDQYDKVLAGFKKKIKSGKVPGVTNPEDAAKYVRKGKITYKQAVNLTKPGTIESLAYDALNGTVICSCAMGLTFVVTVFLTWRNTGNIKEAIQAGMTAGLEVFGISFIQHMLISQVARTSLAKSLVTPSQFIVGKLGYKTTQTIVNGIRSLSGKGAIYGAAATKHLAKILRSNALTATITLVVFSLPETYNLVSKKVSSAQYLKNMSVLAGSMIAGTGGTVATGLAAAKIAGLAGTTVTPGIGTVVGIAGGFVGGVVGAQAIKLTGDAICEDDTIRYARMFNAYVSCLVGEYMLDDKELDMFIEELNKLKPKEFKTLFKDIEKSNEQEKTIRIFLESYLNDIINSRDEFKLPSSDEMGESILEIYNSSDGE